MAVYRQFCPIAKASEILGERWTFLIVRELLLGSRRFNELEKGLPAIPKSLLVHRLKSLEEAGLLIKRKAAPSGKNEYCLTQAGDELVGVLNRLGEWGQRWVNTEIRPQDVDLSLLMWNMRRRLNTALLPPSRVVVQFDYRGAKKETYWLIIRTNEVEVCKTHPGFDPDVFVRADTLSMISVWLGRQDFREAVRKGLIELSGQPDLVRSFPDWLALSPFAHISPAHPAAAVGVLQD